MDDIIIIVVFVVCIMAFLYFLLFKEHGYSITGNYTYRQNIFGKMILVVEYYYCVGDSNNARIAWRDATYKDLPFLEKK